MGNNSYIKSYYRMVYKDFFIWIVIIIKINIIDSFSKKNKSNF